MQERTISLAGKDYVLRYDLFGRRDIEQKLGKGLWPAMQDGEIMTAATILWAGLKHANKKLTPNDVLDLLQAHQDAGGEYDEVFKPAVRAIFDAKLFGRQVEKRHIDLILGEEETPGKAPAAVRAAE